VLDALQHDLMEPDALAEFTQAFIARWNALVAEASTGQASATHELQKV
jgi:hypothetical protein